VVGQATQVDRRRAGLLALEAEVAVDFDIGAYATASIFLWTSIPAIRYGICLFWEARSACRRITQGRVVSKNERRSIIRSITHAPGQQLLGFTGATG
jgi:hypothetical protein